MWEVTNSGRVYGRDNVLFTGAAFGRFKLDARRKKVGSEAGCFPGPQDQMALLQESAIDPQFGADRTLKRSKQFLLGRSDNRASGTGRTISLSSPGHKLFFVPPQLAVRTEFVGS